MSNKLVIVAHGVGNTNADFWREWEDKLHANHPRGDFTVKGLWWDDVLDRVANQFPVVEEDFADAVDRLGFGALKELFDSDAYDLFHEIAMDVLSICAMGEMAHYVYSTCSLRLKNLVGNRSRSTILVGHSLGAAMLPHIVWMERNAINDIPYHGLILLASPLGMKSPIPGAIKDLMEVMAGITGQDRLTVLKKFAREWFFKGDDRLHFILNDRDPICSDVVMKIGPKELDPIPIRQRFTEKEEKTLEKANPGCLKRFAAGSTDVKKVFGNHASMGYLDRPEFQTAFEKLLAM